MTVCHFQYKHQQAKYVSVLKGKILDCVIDLRKKSKTFGKIFKIILSEKNCLSLYIPEGFAHAYLSYEKLNIVYYKLNNFYKPQYESGVNLMDKNLKISWPKRKFKISIKNGPRSARGPPRGSRDPRRTTMGAREEPPRAGTGAEGPLGDKGGLKQRTTRNIDRLQHALGRRPGEYIRKSS